MTKPMTSTVAVLEDEGGIPAAAAPTTKPLQWPCALEAVGASSDKVQWLPDGPLAYAAHKPVHEIPARAHLAELQIAWPAAA